MTCKSSSYGIVVQGNGVILPEQSAGLFKTLNKLSVSLKFRTCLDHWSIYCFIKQGVVALTHLSLLLSLITSFGFGKNLPSHNMRPDFALCKNTTENVTKFLSHSNASFFLYEAIYSLDMWKFYKTLLQHCWRQLFFNLAQTFVGSVLLP